MASTRLKGKSSIIFSLVTIIMIGLLVTMRFFDQSISRYYLVQDGVNTCFGRVMQSFMALSTGGELSSKYLKDRFLGMTQECFGDVLQELEDSTSKVFVLEKMNKVVTNVFQFNQQLKQTALQSPVEFNESESVGSSVIVKKIDQKGNYEGLSKIFSEIENLKDSITDDLDEWKRRDSLIKNWVMRGFYLSLFLIIGMLGFSSFARRRLDEQNEISEKEAATEYNSKDVPSCSRVEELIKNTFEQNGLIHCSKLFSHYNNYLLESAMWSPKLSTDPSQTKNESNESNSRAVETPVHHDQPTIQLQEVDISKVANNLVNVFSKKIFVKGIILKIDISDNVKIWGKEDVVQKIFYHLMGEVIQSFAEENGEKRIRISSKVVRDSVVIEFMSNGRGMSPTNNSDNDFGLNFCVEMMRQFGGGLVLEPVSDKDKVPSDSVRFTLFFRKYDTQNIKLVNIKVGKKKDLLSEM